MLSLHTGYDTAYLTGAVGNGQAGADYYSGAAGEPPGYWQGAGAAALRLAGQVDAEVMRALYHDDTGPDGQVLARRQRPGKYPEASGSLHQRIEAEVAAQVAAAGGIITPEEIREIRLRLRAQWRTRVPFYDYTFSAPKSVSVLWASLLAASAEAGAEGREADAERLAERAGQIRSAVERANDRMIALAERRAAYVRTGHHSATSGQWRDADGFIVASFPQHTNRDGDPQLHVHNAIANRAQRADKAESGDEKWRSLHGQPLFKEKLGFAAYGDRFLAQELEQLGWRTVQRADGNSFEVGGISEDAADAYSDRAKETRDRYRELEADYVADHGHAPGKRARWALKQRAALETRDAKEHNPPEPGRELAAWARKAGRRGIGKLSALHEQAAAYAAGHEPSELPSEAERARVIRIAVAEVQRQNSVWNRSKLTFELGRALGPLPAGTDPETYLDGLAGEAVSGRAEGVTVLQIAPVPDAVPDVERLGVRKDGTSIYRPPGEELFVTKEHRDHEQWLVDVAKLPLPRRVTAEAAAAAVAGTGLDWSQRAAVKGLLTSSRLINCLVAPAGTGKTHAMAAFARIWTEQTGGRVIGLTASENAARQLADEGLTSAVNIAKFLGKIKDSDQTRGHMPVYPGDVLVVDEATQASTDDVLRIVQAARQAGAMVVGAFDPEQLGSVDAGGIFPLIAARHGSWQLTEVRRFTHAWEADASLKLRRGDIAAVAEYAARGRVYHGHQARVYDEAVTLWVNNHLDGRDALLLAASNEEAAVLARLARERLAELGEISGAAEVTLADGNAAGTGDLVRARLNTRIDADGQTLANRDPIRIDGWQDSGFGRLAVASRRLGPGRWSRPFLVPAAYLEQSAELDYAGNVHVAQGRTVDTGHLVVSEGMTRDQLYVGLSRGREKNTLHVVTGAPDPAQPDRAERAAYADAALRRKGELRRAGDVEAADAIRIVMPDRPSDRQMAPWEAVVAQAMQRSNPEGTALEAMQAAQDYVTHTGHLLELYEAFWRKDVVPKIDEMVRQRVTPSEFHRYMRDPERPAFLQVLRAHEIGGRAIPDVLDAITAEPLDGLRSIAAGLHGRAGKEPAPVRGETTGWAERLPRDATAAIAAAGRMLDTRQVSLGEQLAVNPPEWAARAWGMPPAGPGQLRNDWQRRAGVVQSYREAAGITDPQQAIGPVPAGKAHLAKAFHASVRALQLPDDAALMRAMGRGDLEARVQDYIRAEAVAPPDVQAEAGDREHALEAARERGRQAHKAGDAAALDDAEADAERHAEELSRLSVLDAARREWHEATAAQEAAAREAAAELRRRGAEPERESGPETETEFFERLHRIAGGPEAEPDAEPAPEPAPQAEAEFLERLHQMVHGAEPEPDAEAEPEPAETEPEPAPQAETGDDGHQTETTEPEPEPEPSKGLSWDEFNARYPLPPAQSDPEPGAEHEEPEPEPDGQAEAEQAEHQGETEAEFLERLHRIVTDAEASQGAKRQAEAEMWHEIRSDWDSIKENVNKLAAQEEADRARREAIYQANRDEPSIQPEAEAEMEASGWDPGESGGRPEPSASAEAEDIEPEMEIG